MATATPQAPSKPSFRYYRIDIPGTGLVALERMNATPAYWQGILQRLHDAKGSATCTCPGSGTKRMDCFLRNGRYHIRKAPKSGPEHFHDCVHYSSNPKESGIQSYEEGVVIESDGRFTVRLDVSLGQVRTDEPKASPSPKPSSKSGSKSAMTLLGLLNLLWENSRLHTWHPAFEGKRTGTFLSYILRTASEAIVCSKKNLDQSLVLLPPDDSGKSLYPTVLQNEKVIKSAIRTNSRVLVLLELPQGYDNGQPLFFNYQKLTIRLLPESIRRAQTLIDGHANAITSVQRGTPTAAPLRRIMIGIGTPSKSEISITACAAMLTTAQYIPIESSYEWIVADQLVHQQRYFCKPLRYDAASEVFPDFILLDTNQVQFPMEVYGMTTEPYLARKEEKTTYYQTNFGGHHWLWDATQDQTPPDFPLKKIVKEAL